MINFINDERASIYRGIQDTIHIDVGNMYTKYNPYSRRITYTKSPSLTRHTIMFSFNKNLIV